MTVRQTDTLFDLAPLAMLQAEVHVKLLAESPRGTFDEIRDRVRGAQGFQVDGGHVLHLQIGELGLPEGVASVWNLGQERANRTRRPAGQGRAVKVCFIGWGFNRVPGREKTLSAPPGVARWGRKAEIRRASP